jgi:cell volume regulation protein A
MTIELLLAGTALLLLLSVVASKASNRFGIPALVLFLAIGMLAGSDGPGGIYFDDARLAQSLGVVALALILFSGGMDSDWQIIRPVLGPGILLANVGVAVSTLLVGAFAALALGFTWVEGLLLGAIISSTDAAAVFAVLRSRGVNLVGRLEPVIELESGSNDPIAVFLTIALTGLLVDPQASVFRLVPMFVVQMALGALLGYVMGRVMTLTINRVHLVAEGLYAPLTVALALLTYGGTALLGGNGFLAVYIAGIVMGNRNFVHKRSLAQFHDGLAWLMQIAMFLTLGLLVFPSQIVPVVGAGLLVSTFLIFVARPVSVFAALAFSRFDAREKLMVAWVGLRGAVPIVLATYPLLAGTPKAGMIFNLIFFVVLTSVIIQGTTIPLVGRWLRINDPGPARLHVPQEFVPQVSLQSYVAELAIPPGSTFPRRTVMELGLPQGALIVLIDRGGDRMVPNGGTILEAGDRLLVLADADVMERVREILGQGG